MLITFGSLFILLIVLLFVLTIIFLVGGLDAVVNIHRSLTNKLSISMSAVFSSRTVPSVSEAAAFHEGPRDAWFTAAFDADSEPPLGATNLDASVGIGRATPDGVNFASSMSAASTDGSFIETKLLKNERSDKASKVWVEESRSRNESTDCKGKFDLPGPTAAGAGAGAGAVGSRGWCCGIGQRFKRLWSRLPLNKLKILVVVWQILTVFPSIAAVNFPPVYAQFLSWINVINFDLANIFSASCVFPGLNFYERLLVITLAPIALFGVLVVTYLLVKRRVEIGMAGIVEKRAAWSRHMAAGLLLTFLVSVNYPFAQGTRFGKRVEPIVNLPILGDAWVHLGSWLCILVYRGRMAFHGCGGIGGKGRPPPLIATLVPSPPFTMSSPETNSCVPWTLSTARLLAVPSPRVGIHVYFDCSFQDLRLRQNYRRRGELPQGGLQPVM